jgi:multiple sugar transport system permease protein
MSERSVKALHYILLAIIALVFVLPLIWLVVASFDMAGSVDVQ